MNDDNAFLNEMADVTPLKQDRVNISSIQSKTETHLHRRIAAESHAVDSNPLTDSTVNVVGPNDIIAYKRPSIQNNVFRNLRLGKYGFDDRLDLHNHTVAEAREALYQFLQKCIKHEFRSILILHGKGGREGQKQAVIKSHVAHWLEGTSEVLAYHSAPSNQGGAGALYVLLAKSADAKQRSRDKFGLI